MEIQQKIPYTIRSSRRAKYIRISVNCDGVVSVTQPTGISFERIEEIVRKKINWIARKVEFFKSFVVRQRSSPIEYRNMRSAALALAHARIKHFNAFYGFTFKRISIRNQKTRWGSCSKRGTLSFNYRIAKLPAEVADYIVVHELCHLSELNHSKDFWKLVEQSIPHYKALRKALRQNSL